MQAAHSLNRKKLIQACLNARQEWILAFHQLCYLRPFASTQKSSLQEAIQTFCNHLVDYTAWWHFGFFEKVAEILESGQQPLSEDHRYLFSSLTESTQTILDFCDKYQSNENLSTFDCDLSKLAEKMAQRLEWEDCVNFLIVF